MRDGRSRSLMILLALAGLALLVFANYLIARELLGLEAPGKGLSRLAPRLEPVGTPLAFDIEGLESDHPSVTRFAERFGLDRPAMEALPATHPLSIDLGWVLARNPYPPTLAELRGSLPPYISFGYIDGGGAFHQVTSFGGEADTTPSVLTPKARGKATGHGDYFVRYLFHLRRPPSTGDPASQPAIQIMQIDWSTYAGGSYNGFEEIWFTLVATGVEVVLLLLVLGAAWVRRARALRGAGPRPAGGSVDAQGPDPAH